MTDRMKSPLKPDAIVDNLYDIALDPVSLDGFIDAWNDAGLDSAVARETAETIDQFDSYFAQHLTRASAFLKREIDATKWDDVSSVLSPFESLAAFIVDSNFFVVACNDGAGHSFGLREGVDIRKFEMPNFASPHLADGLTQVFAKDALPHHLIKVDAEAGAATVVFQLRRLSHTRPDGASLALVVTTNYHWNEALGDTLEDVFQLTAAEKGVVRALVEGRSAREISVARGTSEGTVRGQIKSILSKMNARTQSEVIRLVLSLREVSRGAQAAPSSGRVQAPQKPSNWWQAEVWKPFQSLALPGGRRMDYHDMGPITGAPVLYTHMGYGQVRWHEPMIRLAFRHGLRVICPIRAGYGHSSNLDPKADVLAATRDDTLCLMAHLGLNRLPYVPQGNDLVFAVDFASKHPEKITEIIGLGARPYLPGDQHFAGMGKWHRFFLSTARHAPHLLSFTAKAAVSMARRIGVEAMFKQMQKNSPADLALHNDPDLKRVMIANAELVAGKTTDVAQAYTQELLLTEAPWDHLMQAAKGTKTTFFNGMQDPAADVAALSAYRELYPWIEIHAIPEGGQMLIYQQFETLIPVIAKAARRAQAGTVG
jgi:pimeloyl-ACP methyl ester carboxylesterase/DNA-binding CsgD family transcriptional regulator